MFQSLSNAMLPAAKRARTENSAETQSKPPEMEDVKNNLPTFNLEPLDDFDTIDDSVLQELMLDFPEEENRDPNMPVSTVQVSNTTQNQQVPPVVTPQMQGINAQFNTVNNTRFPRLPMMYFPNSSVTINYNFK